MSDPNDFLKNTPGGRGVKRLSMSLLWGVLFFALFQALSALVIATPFVPAGTPLLAHTPYLLLAALVVAGSMFAWVPWLERRAEQERSRPAEQPRGLLIARLRAAWIAGVLERPLLGGVRLPLRALAQDSNAPEGQAAGIAALYDRCDGGLLILGPPGAGKTTLLLELARTLLDRAEADPALPIPLVLPLSTWAGQPLERWLAGQLVALYHVHPKQAAEWVAGRLVVPLLDGLDELDGPQQAACEQAIRAFREGRRRLPMVVCGQVRPGETAAQAVDSLALWGAAVVQPLERTAALDALAALGTEASALRAALATGERDWLLELAGSPLGLALLVPAVQHDPALLQATGSAAELRERVAGAAVAAMLGREQEAEQWPRAETLRRLGWLAAQMQARGQTLFLLEGLQPDWLPQRWLGPLVQWCPLLIGGLVFALAFGLVIGPDGALANGLLFALVVLVASWLRNRAKRPVELFDWSWSNATRNLPANLALGSILGAGCGLVAGLFWGLEAGVLGWLLVALVAGLINGFTPEPIRPGPGPNQGLRLLARNALVAGLFAGLFGALVADQGQRLVSALGLGMGVGLFNGGDAVLRHAVLRLLLARAGLAPLRYAEFLDHAVALGLLRRVGGGWIFAHSLLLGHVAGLAPSQGVPLPAQQQRDGARES